MPYCVRESTGIWYEDEGAGDPVLLVHGGLFDPMDGERFWGRTGIGPGLLDAGYRVVVPDRRYCGGRTRAAFAAHSWDVEAGDLRAVLDHGGVAAAHVVAASNGCSAAIRLALTRPDRVRSVLLCWPSTPTLDLRDTFARAVDAIAWAGPKAYLGGLRHHGLPRPESDRPGFPFGAALLADDRMASDFETLPAAEAIRILEQTAAMLDGELLRGVSPRDALSLGRLGLPVGVMPADPEDRHHDTETATRLAAAIPKSTTLPGFPLAPAPGFAVVRDAYLRTLVGWFRPPSAEPAPDAATE